MSRAFSLYLDAARLLAALVVLLSHFAYPRLSGGDFSVIRDLNLGSDAVIVFFVLSGLVIAYVSDNKETTLRLYLASRLSRLFSVAAPAVFLTLAFDAVGRSLDPALYDGWWHAGDAPALRALYALTFTNEIWFSSVRLGTNGPYWSLGYEFWFYMLFAAATFLQGMRRWVWLGLLGLVVGPKVLLLMPSWLIGVLVWRLLRDGRIGWGPRTALLAAAGPPLLYALALSVGLPHDLYRWTLLPFGEGAAAALQFSDEFAWNALLGVLVGLHFLGMARLLAGSFPQDRIWARTLRWGAGHTFTVYLLHYPLLHVLAAALGTDPGAPADQALLLFSTLLGLALLGSLLEPLRYPLRARLLKMLDRMAAPAPKPAPTAAAG